MKKFLGIFMLTLTACSSVMQTKLNTLRNDFQPDTFVQSAESFANNQPIEKQDSLELLISGLALFQAGDFNNSDKAFETWRRRDFDFTGTSLSREAEILVGGNLAAEYKPYMMDSLFVSYYQIWDAIGAGRKSDVRVIINQAYNNQQKMGCAYKDLIKNNQKNPDIVSELNAQNAQWAAYSDIMNPALMYLSGIWFLNSGDYNDAQLYLTRTSGMTNNNKYVNADLKYANNKEKPKNTIWIFIEYGFAPSLYQKQITLPWFTGDHLILVPISIAVPYFNNSPTLFTPVADVNAMFMTEFNEYQINNTMRDLVSAGARAVLQGSLYNSKSDAAPWLGLTSTVYSLATNNAEIRTWATLPEYISVLRGTKSDLIEMDLGGNLDQEIKKLKDGNYLIYLRLTNSIPVIHTFKL